MKTFVSALALALVACPALAGPSGAPDPQPAQLELYRNLPKDPLLVLGISLENPDEELGGLLELVSRIASSTGDGASAGPFDSLGSRLVSTLPHDLLRHVGPEIALSVDLPPIDEAVMAFQQTHSEAVALLFGNVGMLARARNEKQLDPALRQAFTGLGGQIS